MKSRFMIVIAIFLSLFALINYYIGWHIQLFLGSVFHIEQFTLFWICYWLIVFSFLIGRLGSRYMPYWLSSLLKLVGAYWLAIMFFSFVLLPFMDLAAGMLALFSVKSSLSILF